MYHYYILEGKSVKRIYNVEEWSGWYEKLENRLIKRTTIRDVDISTVFLGKVASPSLANDPIPILFETMIFGDVLDGFQKQYATYDEAIETHNRVCEMIVNL